MRSAAFAARPRLKWPPGGATALRGEGSSAAAPLGPDDERASPPTARIEPRVSGLEHRLATACPGGDLHGDTGLPQNAVGAVDQAAALPAAHLVVRQDRVAPVAPPGVRGAGVG